MSGTTRVIALAREFGTFAWSQIFVTSKLIQDVMGCPSYAVDVIKIHCILFKMQLLQIFTIQSSIGTWLEYQLEFWRIIWQLYRFFLLETALDKRLGYSVLSAELPHVDSQAGKNTRPTPRMAGVDGAMATSGIPVVKDIVFIGGGHSHAYCLKSFGMNPMPGVRVTLITTDYDTPYSGMLPGHVAGLYSREECHIDLGLLAKFAGARLIIARATKIDRKKKLVHVTGTSTFDKDLDRPPIPYDVLSINVGSSPSLASSKQLLANPKQVAEVTAVKPISGFSARWELLVQKVRERCLENKVTTVAVVGAGAGGVELLLSMQARLEDVADAVNSKSSKNLVRMVLFGRDRQVVPSHNPRTRAILERILTERSVELYLGSEVVGIEGTKVVCENGTKVDVDECVWCTAASAQSFLRESGFDVDDLGFIMVDNNLQSCNTQNVFAAGDTACMVNQPRPKAGVFAVRQGPSLVKNIRAALLREPLEEYEAQTSFLGILGTGRKYGIASKGELAFESASLWALKDWIDRKWMAGYTSQLPEMPQDSENIPIANELFTQIAGGESALNELGEIAMRCGGCGSKVGASVLGNVVNSLPRTSRDEVLMGLDDPDDCAVLGIATSKSAEAFNPEHDKVVVQTVDAFRSFLDDPFVFGYVIANHSLSDCHAMGADAISAMAIAVVPFGPEPKVENELRQMMTGTVSFLQRDGCALVGGHTSEGPELYMGLSVTGTVDNLANVLSKGGLESGQVLVLTKAVGTGTVMAAHMRVKAKGSWVKSAVDSMCQSNKPAAQVLREHGASSCTDVTGFGVLGHLIEMVKAARQGETIGTDGKPKIDLQAILNLPSIPLLPGALACVNSGIFSSLQPQNVRLRRGVENHANVKSHTAYPLLYDPQTAGGLLASIPAETAETCIDQLRKSGYSCAAVVGKVVHAPREVNRVRHRNPRLVNEEATSCSMPANDFVFIQT